MNGLLTSCPGLICIQCEVVERGVLIPNTQALIEDWASKGSSNSHGLGSLVLLRVNVDAWQGPRKT